MFLIVIVPLVAPGPFLVFSYIFALLFTHVTWLYTYFQWFLHISVDWVSRGGSNRAPALDCVQKELLDDFDDAQMLCPLTFGSSNRAPALAR